MRKTVKSMVVVVLGVHRLVVKGNEIVGIDSAEVPTDVIHAVVLRVDLGVENPKIQTMMYETVTIMLKMFVALCGLVSRQRSNRVDNKTIMQETVPMMLMMFVRK